MKNNFFLINNKIPPIGVEVEVQEIGKSKIHTNTLLKIEWIDQKVVYTWAKNQGNYSAWRYINR